MVTYSCRVVVFAADWTEYPSLFRLVIRVSAFTLLRYTPSETAFLSSPLRITATSRIPRLLSSRIIRRALLRLSRGGM